MAEIEGQIRLNSGDSSSRRIVVATDFSTRSDRAIRRAVLLAKLISAELVLVHVVDDDQAPHLVAAEQREATALVDEVATLRREVDGVSCQGRTILGEPSQGVLQLADEVAADLILLGAHWRQILRDVFVARQPNALFDKVAARS